MCSRRRCCSSLTAEILNREPEEFTSFIMSSYVGGRRKGADELIEHVGYHLAIRLLPMETPDVF